MGSWYRVVAALLSLVPAAARAQCVPEWLTGEGLPGVNRPVSAATTWDPDGPGPRPAVLAVGGYFNIAGSVVSRSVAAWDGSAWAAMNLPSNAQVYALTVYNGELVAGFDYGVARWNGSQWVNLGLVSGQVRTLAVYHGDLIAGGSISTANGVSVNNIARWDGLTWRAMEGGVTGWVQALTEYQGDLIAGGGFSWNGGAGQNIIAWDGSHWRALPGTQQMQTSALTVYHGELIAGGHLAGEGMRPKVARWDGAAWSTVGDGLDGEARALAVFNDQLYVTGAFVSTEGGARVNGAARLEGAAWRPMEDGTSSWMAPGLGSALAVYDGTLVAAGSFSRAGAAGADNVAAWDGTRWRNLGQGLADRAFALAEYSGELVVGGIFRSVGSVSANSIAAWNGSSWRGLGGGMARPNATPEVAALGKYNGLLIAGGTFTSAGGVAANNIAAWDGHAWTPLGDGLTGDGASVRALALFNGELIAGGQFSSAGGAPVHNIAAWNGTSWRALGDGVEGNVTGNLPVHVLAEFQGALIAGGSMLRTGSTNARGIARWDGAAWGPMGVAPPVLGVVRCMVVDRGELIIGGSWPSAWWQGQSLGRSLVRWTGDAWGSFPNLGSDNVRAAAVYAGRLYVAGEVLGGMQVFNGSSWTQLNVTYGPGPLDHGTYGLVDAMVEYGGNLHVAGAFGIVGGRVSSMLAHWGCSCYGNCDGSAAPAALNVGDFVCFMQQYAAGSAYANCDHSTIPPVLSVADFVCFQSRFSEGCP